MKLYLSISEIAQMFDLNRQTLHFYDKKDLFVPEYRDEKTGYRKYSFDQIANLALICYLRKIGFSIDKIKVIMNSKDIDSTIKQFKVQSEILKKQYQEILNTDSIIQRKLNFVESRLKDMEIKKIQIKCCPKRAYISLGQEKILYSNDTFYFFPTIAFYNYNIELEKYQTTFGAYIEPEIIVQQQYKHNIKIIEEQRFLCFYHKGSYDDILKNIMGIRKKYSDLELSIDFMCMNIVDQFLERDNEKFITEVQIPILK